VPQRPGFDLADLAEIASHQSISFNQLPHDSSNSLLSAPSSGPSSFMAPNFVPDLLPNPISHHHATSTSTDCLFPINHIRSGAPASFLTFASDPAIKTKLDNNSSSSLTPSNSASYLSSASRFTERTEPEPNQIAFSSIKAESPPDVEIIDFSLPPTNQGELKDPDEDMQQSNPQTKPQPRGFRKIEIADLLL
jgi:hypothetical protein